MDYSYLETCEAITEDDFRSAVSSKGNTATFLQTVEDISKPGTGVGKVLFFFARLAWMNKEQQSSASYAYEDLALQISLSRRNDTLFEIRLMNNVGDVFEQIMKVTVWCNFEELLAAANDKENMRPFTCTEARENFLMLEATAQAIETSIAPPDFNEADARYEKLRRVETLKPSQIIPTVPPPEEEDPVEYFAEALIGGEVEIPAIPPPPQGLDREPPSELAFATVQASEKPPPRPKFDSLAEEVEALARQEPSLPTEPIGPEDSVQQGLGATIGRLSLVQRPAHEVNHTTPKPRPRPISPLRDRPETERPPGIEEADDVAEPSLPPLPLVTSDAQTPKKTDDVSGDIYDGWE